MRKIFFSLICLFGGIVAFSQENVKWLETVHNFGAFDESFGKVSCQMKFVNLSNEPISIRQVHVTCGCTSPSFDRKPIAPGDTGWVTISYDPASRPGRFEKKIYVDLSTKPERYSLYIKGSVIGTPATINARYPLEKGSLRFRESSAMFGEVTKGRSKSYFMDVYNASGDTLVPVWVDLPSYVSVGAANDTIFPGENKAYTFMIASDKVPEYGLTTDSLQFVAYGNPKTDRRYAVPMTVMVNEDFSRLTPGQMQKAPVIETSESVVNFERISNTDGIVSKTFKILNKGEDPLIIRRAYSGDKGIDVRVDSKKIKKGKSALVTVSVDTTEISGNVLNARLMIISNDPGEPMLGIRVVGEIVK